MARLPLSYFGDPILAQKGDPVTQFGEPLQRLADDMLRTMERENGVGLAAQQVGKALSLFVADFKPDAAEEAAARCLINGKPAPLKLALPLIAANPSLELLDGDWMLYEEGCLSFPDIRGEVARPERVRLTYQNADGESQTLETGGFLARIIQHEFDHTPGIVFVDRMESDVLAPIEGKLKKLKRRTRDSLKAHKK